jgi:hypothetical protein
MKVIASGFADGGGVACAQFNGTWILASSGLCTWQKTSGNVQIKLVLPNTLTFKDLGSGCVITYTWDHASGSWQCDVNNWSGNFTGPSYGGCGPCGSAPGNVTVKVDTQDTGVCCDSCPKLLFTSPLHVTIRNISSCSCMDGAVIPITVDTGDGSWGGTASMPGCTNLIGNIGISCDNGSHAQGNCLNFTMGGSCYHPTDSGPCSVWGNQSTLTPTSCSCSPLQIVWDNVAVTTGSNFGTSCNNTSCCTGTNGTGTIKVILTA